MINLTLMGNVHMGSPRSQRCTFSSPNEKRWWRKADYRKLLPTTSRCVVTSRFKVIILGQIAHYLRINSHHQPMQLGFVAKVVGKYRITQTRFVTAKLLSSSELNISFLLIECFFLVVRAVKPLSIFLESNDIKLGIFRYFCG